MSLNKSKWYKGEDIRGQYIITVEPTNPLSVITDLTGTTFQLIVKLNLNDNDSAALADLSDGDGLTITSISSSNYTVDFNISGESTEDIISANSRNSIVDIYYEFNATYPGTTQADVLDTGTIRIETNRVLKTL